VWFWGAGTVPAETGDPAPLPPLYTVDPLLAGLWLQLGASPSPPPADEAEAVRALADGCVLTLTGASLQRPALAKALGRFRVDILTRDGLVAEPPRRGLRALRGLLVGRWRR
jgi:hypothetical protein